MNGDKGGNPFLPISGILVILAAIGVTFFPQSPFKGSRPSVPEHRESYEKVNARLWQDPFHAVLESANTSKTLQSAGQLDINTESSLKGSSFKKLASLTEKLNGRKKVTVLGVMVSGAPYAEDAEARMRLRYAVLSGLNRIRFIPEDSEHIRYIQTEISEKLTLSNILPFEWLQSVDKENDKDLVLLLWINDAVFGDNPLPKLARLVRFLKQSSTAEQTHVVFKLIGPASSTTLLAMVKDVSDDSNPNRLQDLRGLEIYSAMATVDNMLLLKDGYDGAQALSQGDAFKKIENKFNSRKIKFVRTIGSDRGLYTKLVNELRLRKVDLREKNTHLALIAEWDTLYGRSFYSTLREVFKEEGVSPEQFDLRVHRSSYLRGIDGSLPGEKEETKSEKSETTIDPLNDLKKLEQPIGKSQYDYLRRLAEETYRLDRKLEANSTGRIKAIGVLGSDFYDKYLVLQALRQRLPDVVFFTTDMDARLLHPNNIQWTRNLIVASNFGLSLRKDDDIDIQGETPPFRDNYQTSLFFAVLRAFTDHNYLNQAVSESIRAPVQPLIFEVGRHRAVDLTTHAAEDKVHPRNPPFGNSRIYGKVLILFILLPFLLFLTSTTCVKYKGSIIVLLITLAGFALVAIFVGGLKDEEPLSIFEGVSVWPTELFRVVAILLSVFFLHLSRKTRKENRDLIRAELGLPEDAGGLSKTHDFKLPGSVSRSLLSSLWADYIRQDSGWRRAWHVLFVSTLYFIFCFVIISFDLPVSPVRGPISSRIDFAVTLISVLFLIVLIFYVLAVTRCCRRFIITVSDRFSALERPDSDIKDQIKSELTLVQLIAMRTETIGKLIFYPFIVWFVIFVSRLDYFDNWRTPVGLAVVITMGALYAWSCAFLLRQSAERARTSVVNRLKKLLFHVLTDESRDHDMVDHIQFVINEVKSMREGAFAPVMQHPLVQALVVPFGGVGGVYLIDFFTKMNI